MEGLLKIDLLGVQARSLARRRENRAKWYKTKAFYRLLGMEC